MCVSCLGDIEPLKQRRHHEGNHDMGEQRGRALVVGVGGVDGDGRGLPTHSRSTSCPLFDPISPPPHRAILGPLVQRLLAELRTCQLIPLKHPHLELQDTGG